MKEKVFNVVSCVLKVPVEQINEESSPDTIEEWDSLSHLNLIMALEQEFGISFSEEQIMNLLNVKLILQTLEELCKK
jgi:acyl carrier protein